MATINGDALGVPLPDILVGTAEDDTINGLGSADILSGAGGDDLVNGGDGDDLSLSGGDGNDVLDGGSSSGSVPVLDVLGVTVLNAELLSLYDGGAGNDMMIASEQALLENFNGGEGIDTVDFSRRNQAVNIDLARTGFGLLGVELFDQVVATENVIGSSFADLIQGDDGANVLDGNDGDDTLDGHGGDDELIGGAGDDSLHGREGDDTLSGGTSDDELFGAGGADQLAGGTGEDRLLGGNGDDELEGGSGGDVLSGGAGDDTMAGADGNDIYYVDSAGDTVSELPGDGVDQVRAGVDHVLSANVENLVLAGEARSGTGNDLANTIFGAGGGDTLSGLDGDDILRGNGARDTLLGGAGTDLLDGGAGKDTLTGGAGRDVFQFRDGDFGSNRSLADVITDFSQADNEKISLNLADADAGTTGDQAFTWIGDGAFTGAVGELRYAQQGGNTYVEGDLNGDGLGDVFLALTGTITLEITDFVL